MVSSHFAWYNIRMDNKALYNLSYGVFLLGTKTESGSQTGEKINACITNTCFQAANSPTRIAISVIKQNLTCSMIQESGVFALSVLDSTCTFETIKRFGYQSGRETDKFSGFEYETAANGCPYIAKEACSVLEAKVCSSTDLGTHMLFIAEVTDARVLSENAPLTYADYQSHVKPKTGASGAAGSASGSGAGSSAGEQKKIKGWRCKICGYVYEGAELPADFLCPLCGHPAEDFEPVYE